MRNLKKFLALVLSVMMVMSLFITASAKSIDKDGKGQVFTDTTDSEFQTAIDVLAGMEVLKGDANPATGVATGNFRPNDPITRAEVAALVFRLSTGLTDTNAANHYAQYGNFSDVSKDAWYAGYVGYCANAGYIKGYDPFEGGRFGPTDYVTGYQATAMILRAMGYGVNKEFEGGNWALNVASVGTQNGILKTVNSTHFGNATLYEYAPRQVVAEIFFQAALTNCVVYTPAFGYQTTDIALNNGFGVSTGTNQATDNGLTANSSLGLRYFGLTETTRVILGNQATGESCTVLGGVWNATESNNPYAYPGSVLTWEEDGTTAKTYAGGLYLKVDTDLMMFGHKVTAYYDARGTGVHRTYAIYDKATYKYAYSEDDNIVSGTLGKQAEAAGFSVDKANGAHISDRFGWISTSKRNAYASDFEAITDNYDPTHLYDVTGSTTTTIKEDNGDDGRLPYGSAAANGTTNHRDGDNEPGSYYLMINNGTGLDVVITVAPELERVTEHNTTASVHTLRLSGLSDGTMGYNPWKPSTFGEADNGIIRMDSVTEGSETNIGSLVVGWEIKGTAYEVNYNNEIIKSDNSLYTYYLQPITEKVTGTVKYYNGATGEVTLSTSAGDKTLKWTRLPVVNSASSPALDGVDGGDGLANAYFYNGEQYTFTIDPTDSSRYVDYTQGNDYEFLYATYGDYDMGGLGSAELGYYVTGVNWNGEIVENKLVKTITGDVANGDGVVNGARYEALTIAKKNLGSANGINTIGNEIMEGYYTGYGYNAGTNDLDVEKAGVTNRNTDNWLGYWDGTVNYHKYWDGKLVSTFSGDDGSGVWTVDKSNVADGWADQSTGLVPGAIGKLLLTPNTKFILVDGVGLGSSNKLTVDVRNGISGLLGTSNDVTIDVKRFDATDTQLPDYNVYYKLVKDQYNNLYKDDSDLQYSDDNYMVDTVILPKAAVTWSDNSNLWFTNKTTYNGIYLAGQDAHGFVEQLTMWRNGEKQEVFVDTRLGSLNGNPIVDDAKYGMFYKLTEAYKIGSTPVYEATRMTTPAMDNVYGTANAATICDLDLKYDYTAVNNTSTARLTQMDIWSGYNLTATGSVKSNVYNVGDANVTNVCGIGTITNIRELNNAVSVGYRVTVAIVNNGHAVSQIYVTNVEAPGTW